MSLLVSASFFEFYLPYLLPIGLILFGLLFAMISSIHSYLVLSYSDGDKAASSVGFYYMANASGRLVGTLLSGILYHFGSLTACLSGSLVFVMINGLISIYLPKKELAPKRKKQK
jgi:MFS family permease